MPEMAEPMAAGAEPSETTSIFIPKDALGGRDCKPGEKLTFTVSAVDDETGEVEAKVEGYKEPHKSGGLDKAMDALPDDEEEM